MELTYTLVVTLSLTLIVVDCAGIDLEVKGASNTGLGSKVTVISSQNNILSEEKDGSDFGLDAKKVDPVKKGKDQVDGSREGVRNSDLEKNNSSKQLETKEVQNVQTNRNKNDSLKEVDKNEKTGEVLDAKKVPKEGTLPPVRKENYQGEKCDSSNWCTDEKNALLACLRVPGNESPDLSLLIQNKGKGPLSVTISAPDFVRLEKTHIQLLEKEDKKVKVSVSKKGADNLIILSAGNSNCSLDFRDLIVHNSRKEVDYTSQSTYINLPKQTPSIGFIFLAVVLLMALVWMCVSFQRRHFASKGSKYEKLETQLPVSNGPKTEHSNDGWDNSWGDSWDDEEAPKTPSMPVTPSLSSKSTTSRRVIKEGWKD